MFQSICLVSAGVDFSEKILQQIVGFCMNLFQGMIRFANVVCRGSMYLSLLDFS